MLTKNFIKNFCHYLNSKDKKVIIREFLNVKPSQETKYGFWIDANSLIPRNKALLSDQFDKSQIANTFAILKQEEIDKIYLKTTFKSLKECFDFYSKAKGILERRKEELFSTGHDLTYKFMTGAMDLNVLTETLKAIQEEVLILNEEIKELDFELNELKKLYLGSSREYGKLPRRFLIGVSGNSIYFEMRPMECIPLTLEEKW